MTADAGNLPADVAVLRSVVDNYANARKRGIAALQPSELLSATEAIGRIGQLTGNDLTATLLGIVQDVEFCATLAEFFTAVLHASMPGELNIAAYSNVAPRRRLITLLYNLTNHGALAADPVHRNTAERISLALVRSGTLDCYCVLMHDAFNSLAAARGQDVRSRAGVLASSSALLGEVASLIAAIDARAGHLDEVDHKLRCGHFLDSVAMLLQQLAIFPEARQQLSAQLLRLGCALQRFRTVRPRSPASSTTGGAPLQPHLLFLLASHVIVLCSALDGRREDYGLPGLLAPPPPPPSCSQPASPPSSPSAAPSSSSSAAAAEAKRQACVASSSPSAASSPPSGTSAAPKPSASDPAAAPLPLFRPDGRPAVRTSQQQHRVAPKADPGAASPEHGHQPPAPPPPQQQPGPPAEALSTRLALAALSLWTHHVMCARGKKPDIVGFSLADTCKELLAGNSAVFYDKIRNSMERMRASKQRLLATHAKHRLSEAELEEVVASRLAILAELRGNHQRQQQQQQRSGSRGGGSSAPSRGSKSRLREITLRERELRVKVEGTRASIQETEQSVKELEPDVADTVNTVHWAHAVHCPPYNSRATHELCMRLMRAGMAAWGQKQPPPPQQQQQTSLGGVIASGGGGVVAGAARSAEGVGVAAKPSCSSAAGACSSAIASAAASSPSQSSSSASASPAASTPSPCLHSSQHAGSEQTRDMHETMAAAAAASPAGQASQPPSPSQHRPPDSQPSPLSPDALPQSPAPSSSQPTPSPAPSPSPQPAAVVPAAEAPLLVHAALRCARTAMLVVMWRKWQPQAQTQRQDEQPQPLSVLHGDANGGASRPPCLSHAAASRLREWWSALLEAAEWAAQNPAREEPAMGPTGHTPALSSTTTTAAAAAAAGSSTHSASAGVAPPAAPSASEESAAAHAELLEWVGSCLAGGTCLGCFEGTELPADASSALAGGAALFAATPTCGSLPPVPFPDVDAALAAGWLTAVRRMTLRAAATEALPPMPPRSSPSSPLPPALTSPEPANPAAPCGQCRTDAPEPHARALPPQALLSLIPPADPHPSDKGSCRTCRDCGMACGAGSACRCVPPRLGAAWGQMLAFAPQPEEVRALLEAVAGLLQRRCLAVEEAAAAAAEAACELPPCATAAEVEKYEQLWQRLVLCKRKLSEAMEFSWRFLHPTPLLWLGEGEEGERPGAAASNAPLPVPAAADSAAAAADPSPSCSEQRSSQLAQLRQLLTCTAVTLLPTCSRAVRLLAADSGCLEQAARAGCVQYDGHKSCEKDGDGGSEAPGELTAARAGPVAAAAQLREEMGAVVTTAAQVVLVWVPWIAAAAAGQEAHGTPEGAGAGEEAGAAAAAGSEPPAEGTPFSWRRWLLSDMDVMSLLRLVLNRTQQQQQQPSSQGAGSAAARVASPQAALPVAPPVVADPRVGAPSLLPGRPLVKTVPVKEVLHSELALVTARWALACLAKVAPEQVREAFPDWELVVGGGASSSPAVAPASSA